MKSNAFISRSVLFFLFAIMLGLSPFTTVYAGGLDDLLDLERKMIELSALSSGDRGISLESRRDRDRDRDRDWDGDLIDRDRDWDRDLIGRDRIGRDRDRRDRDRGRRGRYNLGEEKLDKFFVKEYRFRANGARAGSIILSTRKGAADIRSIEIVYDRGDVHNLYVSGTLPEDDWSRIRIPFGRVRYVLITAISPDLFGSRCRLTVELGR